jgi:hypothetical protein
VGRGRLGLVLVAAALAGCGEDDAPPAATPPAGRACTEIGCGPPSAIVQLRGLPAGRVSVRVCAEQQCQTLRGRGEELSDASVELPERAADSVRVLVEVRSGGRVLGKEAGVIPVTSERPNGPDCPPVCRFARARFDVATGRLEAA